MTGVPKWKLAVLALGVCVAGAVLYLLAWNSATRSAVLSPIAGLGFGLSLSLGLRVIPVLTFGTVIVLVPLYLYLGLDPRLAFFSVPVAALILAAAVKMITRKIGSAPALVRRNEVLWFGIGALFFSLIWGTVETILTEGVPRIFWSSTETERLVRRIFRDVAGLLTIGPVCTVYAGPWIRRWLGLSTKDGLTPSRRDYRDTFLVVVLFVFAFWLASALKTAWQVDLYYICLLPLLYFAAQRGLAVTTLSLFGCAITATALWNHSGLSTALQISDLRTLLSAYAMTALVIAGQAGERIHAFRLQGDLVRQLRRLTAHLESVREDEQTRIAREVHDELGGLLTALKLDLGMLRRQLGPLGGDAAISECHRLSASVDTIISAVQRIATELRPGVLDNLGLAAAVQWAAQDFERRSGARCVASPVEEVPAGKELATAVYKILQEALTNISRHSGASEVWISLTHSGATVELRVEDNGKGISDENLLASDSLGLTGMRERAAALGGELEIDRLSRGGTAVRARIPISARRAVGAAK